MYLNEIKWTSFPNKIVWSGAKMDTDRYISKYMPQISVSVYDILTKLSGGFIFNTV